MKNRKLRLLALVLALCLLLSMAACTAGPKVTDPTKTDPTQGQTNPPTTATPTTAPTTVPPTTVPPTTVPPTEPPTTVPPTVPPTTVPPTVPPTTVPPTVPPTEPPATEPPAPNNDIGKEITQDGFTIKVLSVKQEGNQYTAVFALSYVGDISHSLSAKERIFVVNADRRSIPVEQVYDSEGNSLMGTSIENGQTLTITAVFTLTDGFTPAAFRYVYDIMGFRRLQAEL